MEQKITKNLSRFGLTEPEIQIYTAILRLDKRIARALTSMFDALWLTGQPRKFE